MTSSEVYLTVDLGYGDSGKGTIVDFLARETDCHTVVRFNGGPQAAHNVVTPDGRHHTFSQFGSGTFVPGVQTHLSEHMLFDPICLLAENEHLLEVGVSDALARLYIDEQALLVTPWHRAANRLREIARGMTRHGSCGMGIGETMAAYEMYGGKVPRAGDINRPSSLRDSLKFVRQALWQGIQSLVDSIESNAITESEIAMFQSAAVLEDFIEASAEVLAQAQLVSRQHLAIILSRPGSVIFEAAQGVLLDQVYGFFPYCTRSTTTLENARALLATAKFSGDVTSIGIMRAFMTRHGAGPFVTQCDELDHAYEGEHNVTNDWQENFRLGWFDAVALRYAATVVGELDYLAVTHLDNVLPNADMNVCVGYKVNGLHLNDLPVPSKPTLASQQEVTEELQQVMPVYINHTGSLDDYVSFLSLQMGLPIGLTSVGQTAKDKLWLHKEVFC